MYAEACRESSEYDGALKFRGVGKETGRRHCPTPGRKRGGISPHRGCGVRWLLPEDQRENYPGYDQFKEPSEEPAECE